MNTDDQVQTRTGPGHSYAGMWVTADGYVRHNLLPNGRYDEARGSRECARARRHPAFATVCEKLRVLTGRPVDLALKSDGAGGRTRTDISVRTADFESAASTNSATPAHCRRF